MPNNKALDLPCDWPSEWLEGDIDELAWDAAIRMMSLEIAPMMEARAELDYGSLEPDEWEALSRDLRAYRRRNKMTIRQAIEQRNHAIRVRREKAQRDALKARLWLRDERLSRLKGDLGLAD